MFLLHFSMELLTQKYFNLKISLKKRYLIYGLWSHQGVTIEKKWYPPCTTITHTQIHMYSLLFSSPSSPLRVLFQLVNCHSTSLGWNNILFLWLICRYIFVNVICFWELDTFHLLCLHYHIVVIELTHILLLIFISFYVYIC